MDGYRRPVVFRSGEHPLCLVVMFCDMSHHATHRFDTQRQRVTRPAAVRLHITGQYAALYRCADSHSSSVNVFTRLLPKKSQPLFLHHWHTGSTANEDHVVDIRHDSQRPAVRLSAVDRTVHQIFNRAFQFRTSHFDVHVFRPVAFAVMYGRFTSVRCAEDSSISGFFCGFRRCIAV